MNPISLFFIVGSFLGGLFLSSTTDAAEPTVQVYRSASCGCCLAWVEHLRQNGFDVIVEENDNMLAVKQEHGVPDSLRSCHTAVVLGKTIEGHVPAETIRRFLESPDGWSGIAVPGMPLGSPGMEVPGMKGQDYAVLAFRPDGSREVFEEIRGK